MQKGTVTNCLLCTSHTTLLTLPLDGFVKAYREQHIGMTILWPSLYGSKDVTFQNVTQAKVVTLYEPIRSHIVVLFHASVGSERLQCFMYVADASYCFFSATLNTPLSNTSDSLFLLGVW